ncbi:MAG TPA: hypothetical protein VMI11_03145 [Actinomycetes bacterium]|nr:hypothetical protein [Actinomycetes bacterium]
MSVIVITKFPGAKASTLEALVQGKYRDMAVGISKVGQASGAIHHMFIEDTDGGALALDEWDSAESYVAFFSAQEDIKQLSAEAGVNAMPESRVYRILDTPDTF